MVFGYGLAYIGIRYFHDGTKVGFAQAFFPAGLFGGSSGTPSFTGSNNPPNQSLSGRLGGNQAFVG